MSTFANQLWTTLFITGNQEARQFCCCCRYCDPGNVDTVEFKQSICIHSWSYSSHAHVVFTAANSYVTKGTGLIWVVPASRFTPNSGIVLWWNVHLSSSTLGTVESGKHCWVFSLLWYKCNKYNGMVLACVTAKYSRFAVHLTGMLFIFERMRLLLHMHKHCVLMSINCQLIL